MLDPAACDNLTDEELIRCAADRDEHDRPTHQAKDAFDELYGRHASKLLGYMVNRLLRSDADDAAQEVWRRVWSSAHRFDGDNFRAWLYTIARNHLNDRFRRSRGASAEPEGDLPDPNPTEPWAPIIQKELEGALRKCLDQLSDQDAALVRRRLAGRSYEQVCDELGIEIKRAYKRMHDLKERLTECVQQTLA